MSEGMREAGALAPPGVLSVRGADVQPRPNKEMPMEQLQQQVRTITTAHMKGLAQPFSSAEYYTLGKTIGEGAYGKVSTFFKSSRY
jgi:hypothetical protein